MYVYRVYLKWVYIGLYVCIHGVFKNGLYRTICIQSVSKNGCI